MENRSATENVLVGSAANVLTPERLSKYADVMVWALQLARRTTGKGASYAPGDVVVLRYQPAASALAEPIYRRLLRQGLNVATRQLVNHEMEAAFYQEANKQQLKHVSAWDKALYRRMSGLIHLAAPESLTHLKDCDPAKLASHSRAQKQLMEIRSEREYAGKFGWTVCMMPTAALARQALMNETEYALEIVKACYLDCDDPVAKWQDTMAKIDRVKDWLTALPIEYVHVESDDGQTDLKVWVGERRRWLGGSGHNIPSFEIFLSPEAGRAEGRYHANESSFKMGRYVRGVRLEFAGGEVTRVTAEAEEEFVRSRVALDAGSRRIGEFSLTDRRFSEITKFMASTLFDENVGGQNGNCHIAIGSSYPECYAGDEPMTAALYEQLKFNASAEHWDLVNTSAKTVAACLKGGGREVIYQDGQFTGGF